MQQNFVGIDIIEIKRINIAVSRWGDRFLNRIFTDSEIALYRGRTESLAVRFAAKEAAFKAFGSAFPDIKWKEVEILNRLDGKPVINLYGSAKIKAAELGLESLEISLSHSKENAIALVVGSR